MKLFRTSIKFVSKLEALSLKMIRMALLPPVLNSIVSAKQTAHTTAVIS